MIDIGFDNAVKTPQPAQSRDILNLTLSTSMAANAATIAVKTIANNNPSASDPVKIGFLNSGSSGPSSTLVSLTASLSLTIPSSATLGHQNATDNYIWVWALNNGGSIELAVSGAFVFEPNTLQSTTAISAASTSPHVLYSTNARTSKAIRLIGRIKSNQATAGTWVTAFSEVVLQPIRLWPMVAVIRDEKANTTAGGTFTAGSDQTRTLNTLYNPDLIVASLSSNQFTLPPGTYKFYASAPVSEVGNHRAKLVSVSGTTITIFGNNANTQNSNSNSNRSYIIGTGILYATTTFELRHRCSIGNAATGFGRATSFGDIEVYSQVEITRLY